MRGRVRDVDGIEYKPTRTRKSNGAAADLNDIVIPACPVGFVERSGRVWLLADGPIGDEAKAVVYVAANNAGEYTKAQDEAIAVLDAVLSTAYSAASDADTGLAPIDPAPADGDAPGDPDEG